MRDWLTTFYDYNLHSSLSWSRPRDVIESGIRNSSNWINPSPFASQQLKTTLNSFTRNFGNGEFWTIKFFKFNYHKLISTQFFAEYFICLVIKEIHKYLAKSSGSPFGKHLPYIFKNSGHVNFPVGQSLINPLYHPFISSFVTIPWKHIMKIVKFHWTYIGFEI